MLILIKNDGITDNSKILKCNIDCSLPPQNQPPATTAPCLPINTALSKHASYYNIYKYRLFKMSHKPAYNTNCVYLFPVRIKILQTYNMGTLYTLNI